MPIEAGRLRHRVRFESFVLTLDSNGDTMQSPETGVEIGEWVLAYEAWAAVEPLSAREFIASQSVQSKVVARIIMRQRPDIDPAMRIVFRGKVYNIEGVIPDQSSGLEYLTLPVSYGVNLSGQ